MVLTRIYFIKPIGFETPIKIGHSVSPDKRRETLETWCPFPLEIVAQIEGPRDLERRFHALFADLHERHEWFRISNELQAVIREINEGTFDIDALPEPVKLPVAPRNNNYLTSAWRYKSSVCARIRNMPYSVEQSRAVTRFFGCDPSRIPSEAFDENKELIESFLAALRQQIIAESADSAMADDAIHA